MSARNGLLHNTVCRFNARSASKGYTARQCSVRACANDRGWTSVLWRHTLRYVAATLSRHFLQSPLCSFLQFEVCFYGTTAPSGAAILHPAKVREWSNVTLGNNHFTWWLTKTLVLTKRERRKAGDDMDTASCKKKKYWCQLKHNNTKTLQAVFVFWFRDCTENQIVTVMSLPAWSRAPAGLA